MQIAALVYDANECFRESGHNTVISMEVGEFPEVYINTNWNGNDFLNHYRYLAKSVLPHDNVDPRFDAAEHRIRTLMEEAGRG